MQMLQSWIRLRMCAAHASSRTSLSSNACLIKDRTSCEHWVRAYGNASTSSSSSGDSRKSDTQPSPSKAGLVRRSNNAALRQSRSKQRTKSKHSSSSSSSSKQSSLQSSLRRIYNKHEPKLFSLVLLHTRLTDHLLRNWKWYTFWLVACSFAWHHRPLYPTTGPSMLPTLAYNDGVLWLSWYRRGRGVVVGDVVVAASPYRAGDAIVKRVVGMPGDVVCVFGRGYGHNAGAQSGDSGEQQKKKDESEDDDVQAEDDEVGRQLRLARYIVVPRGHCWIEGDNLPFSVDSRHYGPLPLGLVAGKVVAICGGGAGGNGFGWIWNWRWLQQSDGLEDVVDDAD